jgi:RNA polymerase sigma-70 factor (ECF subfamily)
MQDSSDAVRDLFEAHGTAIYRFAAVLLRRREDAEDVVQETFMKLLRHLEAGGDMTNLRGWLFTVAAHAARDRQRGRQRWMPWAAAPEPAVAPVLLDDEDGRLRAARDALARLPERDRLLLALRTQGLSYRDIAAATGLEPTSVGRLLARAVDRWKSASAAGRERAAASEPRDRRQPAPFGSAPGAVSAVESAERRAKARVGGAEGRRPSG